MATHRIRRGLRLPLGRQPDRTVESSAAGRCVAVLGDDFVGLKPKLHVAVGDEVDRGQVLFVDKRHPTIRFVSPGHGTVCAIHRGAKRRLESVVIELSDAERSDENGEDHSTTFATFRTQHPRDLRPEEVTDLLLESGEWTGLRQRPFSRVAAPDGRPTSLFVTATDSNPLAPPVDAMLQGRDEDLEFGLHALSTLTDGPVFVCTDQNTEIALPSGPKFRQERFDGPHPAGTVGLHIHRLDPVDRERVVWHIAIQDVLAVGHLFRTGRLDLERVISLAGPAVSRPRLLRVRRGASIDALCAGELVKGDVRVISGSALSGRQATGEELGYLGRYHQQVTVLCEQRERTFIGWLGLGPRGASVAPTLWSRWLNRRPASLGTATDGDPRAIVPIGLYERVLPMDFEPAFLLKAIMMLDAQWAERLGCLELDEEDLALCAFVCPGKSDFGPHLRQVLTALEQERA